jgi:hypothetical protein
VNDALQRITNIEKPNAGGPSRLSGFGDERRTARQEGVVPSARAGVNNVIHGAKNPRGIEDRTPGLGEAFKGDGAGALMQEYAVDRDQCRAAL